MLLYHPAFDAYHCLFRSLLLLRATGDRWIEVERLRIFDFYVLFPREITTITDLPRLVTPVRAKFADYPQHEAISNPAKVFYQLEEIFRGSMQALHSFGLVTINEAEQTVKPRHLALPEAFQTTLAARETESAEVIRFIKDILLPIPLNGPGGLKYKTHLLPYRYDRK